VTNEQCHLKLLFKLGDLPTQSRLSNEELFGRTAETSALGHFYEGA